MKTSASRSYDPHKHAEDLSIEVVYRRLRTANGLWVPEIRTVFLQPRMHRARERSILAHELVHAEFGDVGRSDYQEARADRVAAQRLIDGNDLRAAALLSDDPGAWALELDVTDHMLEVFLRAKTDEVRVA